MALIKKNNKNKKTISVKEQPFEKKKDLDKLYLYFTVVNAGQADAVIDLMEYAGSSAQYVQRAVGTAPSNLMSILNISDNKKEIVISFIKESLLDDAQKELNAFFQASKKNKGIAFAVPLKSIMGVRVYKFLTRTI